MEALEKLLVKTVIVLNYPAKYAEDVVTEFRNLII